MVRVLFLIIVVLPLLSHLLTSPDLFSCNPYCCTVFTSCYYLVKPYLFLPFVILLCFLPHKSLLSFSHTFFLLSCTFISLHHLICLCSLLVPWAVHCSLSLFSFGSNNHHQSRDEIFNLDKQLFFSNLPSTKSANCALKNLMIIHYSARVR